MKHADTNIDTFSSQLVTWVGFTMNSTESTNRADTAVFHVALPTSDEFLTYLQND